MQSVQDGVIRTTLDGHVRFVNSSAEAMTGWSNEQAVGHDVCELVRFRSEPNQPAAGGQRPTDATKRVARRLEQESRLRASEERFRNAFDHAPLGMALVTLDGRFLQVNSALCQFLGSDAERLKAMRHYQVTWPTELDHERQQLRALLARGESVVQFEKRYRHADGQTVLCSLVSVSLMLEDERPACWLYQVLD